MKFFYSLESVKHDWRGGDYPENFDVEEFWKAAEATVSAQKFAESMIAGMKDRLPELDGQITKYAQNWDLKRMAAIDRNILRLAFYEFLHRTDIPPVVTINEAVDIAKDYSTEESGKFVNGILDRAASELGRPAREALKQPLAKASAKEPGAVEPVVASSKTELKS